MTYTDYISWLILFCEIKGSDCNMESALEQQDCGESNMAVEGDDSCLSIKPVPRYGQSIGSIIRFDCEARSNTKTEAKFRYCPVQVCQLNGTWSTASLSCAKNECTETGKHYNGRRVCTKSGIPCQSWTSQVPHPHGFVYGDVFPDKTIEHAGSTCRDPGFLRGSPWCYTLDKNIEWDFCDIANCQDVPVNEIPCSEGQNEQTDCGLPDFQLRADNECVSLAPLETFETTEGSALIYICAKLQEDVMSFNDYCPVEVCQANGTWSPAYVSCAENECYVDGKSREYKGKRICTSNGLQCKPWNEIKDKTFHLHSFPDETIQSAGSYCRDPNGERGSPWCYTDNVLWDYCSVPKCSDILTEEFICRETEATTVTVPSNMLDITVVYDPRLEIENNQPVDQEFTTYYTKIADDKKVTRPDNLEQSPFYTTASPTTDAKDMYSVNIFATDKIQTNDDLPHQLQTAETTKVIESFKTGWNVETSEKYQTKELTETSKQLTTFALKDGTEYFQISSALDTTTASSKITEKTAGAQVQTTVIKYKTKPAHISEVTDVSKDGAKPAHISEATDVIKDETKPPHISEATDVSKDGAKPAHISDATNVSKDETKPNHISEATDVFKDKTKPVHISEATDVIKDETKPPHISEAMDVLTDETKPVPISEATDVVNDETKPVHISGTMDVSKDETKPVHISEAVNVLKDETKPAHIAEVTNVLTDETKPAHISEVTDVLKDETKPAHISEVTDVLKDETKPAHISEVTDVLKDETKLAHISETTDVFKDETGTSTHITSLDQLMTTEINEASQDSRVDKVTKDLMSVQSATVDNIQTKQNTKYSPDHDLTESMHTITDDISTKTTAPIDGLLHTTEMIEMVKHIKQDKTTDQVIDSDQPTLNENIINHINDNNEQTTALYDRIVSVSAMTYNNKLEDESRTDTLFITLKNSIVHKTDLDLAVTSKEARTFPLLDGNIANDANDTNVENEHGSSVSERQRDSVTANAQAGTTQKYELGDTKRNTSRFLSTIDGPITTQIETDSKIQHTTESSTDNIWTRQSVDSNHNHMVSSSSYHEDTTPESKPKLEHPIDNAITINSTTNIKLKPDKSETASTNLIKCPTGSVLFTQFTKASVHSRQIQRVLSQGNILDCARVCRSISECVLFRYIAKECTIFGSDYMGDDTIDCSSDQSCYRRIQ